MVSLENAEKIGKLIETIVKRTINPSWKFTRNGSALHYLVNGVEQLPSLFGIDNLEEERIVDYIVYQLYRSRTALEQGNWQYTWLFSKAALDKYKKQFMSDEGKSGINYYIDQWLNEGELTRGQLLSIIAKPKPNPLRRMVYLESEEPIKRRFYNTEAGFALCQQSTTGWSPLSAACKDCKKWIDCGKITAQRYPELMRFRKEAYGKKEK